MSLITTETSTSHHVVSTPTRSFQPDSLLLPRQLSPVPAHIPDEIRPRSRRTIYYGVKRGKVPGVYTTARRAEEQVIDFPDACVRCFSTRYGARAYVGGWDCKARYSLPKGSPLPLYEYLLFNYSIPPHLLSPPTRSRKAYLPPRPILINMNEFGGLHSSLPSELDDHPSLASSSDCLTPRASMATLRPRLTPIRNSYRDSMVKSPSPLRHQVDEPLVVRPWANRVHSVIGVGGIHTPPASPEEVVKKGAEFEAEGTGTTNKEKKRSSIFGFSTFSRKPSTPADRSRTVPEPSPSKVDTLSPLPSSPRRELRSSRSSPHLPQTVSSRQKSPSRPTITTRQSGLWADSSSSLVTSPSEIAGLSSDRRSYGHATTPPSAFTKTDAPTFSRSAMRKSGIVMPVSASSSSARSPPMTRRSPSTPSLSPSSSSSSLSTLSSSSSSGHGSRSSSFNSNPDSDFAPPRAGFMGRPSSLSLSTSPYSSSESVATITSKSPVDSYSETFEQQGYPSDLLGIRESKGQRGDPSLQNKKEKKEGMMKGFGKMFGMKNKA